MAAASSRAFSPPPLSYAASSTTGPTSSATISSRIVHKLAIEGRCSGEDAGASLRLYMKIILPLEGLVGGSSVPLFPEENVRIVTSKVQPLDSTSTPYAFSSSAVPLLHKAARALNLPARSNKSYYTFLGIPPPTQATGTPIDPGSSRRAAAAAPLPLSVTGEINVSNFHICFILPKILPTRGAVLADNDEHPTSRHHRRASFVDGKTILFMAGVEIFVPFIACPPKAPYQLSLPLPRCLSNHIKLRVMPPVKKHAGHEPPPWDLTSDPLVTYKPSHGARSTSYEQLADDEISLEDSVETGAVSASSSGVQGTFPSSERIRIRWAAPMNRNQGLGVLPDGRRRVGVDEAVGSMHCTILGRDEQQRTKLRLEYEGTCKGLWFPGVATQVGLVVVLDGKGRHLTWASEDDRWEISGGNGLTGHDGVLPPPPPENSMTQSDRPSHISRPSITQSRLSSYGGASLLQTALPNNSLLPDYSFETTPSPTVSMIDSSGTRYGQSSSSSGVLLPSAPDKEITLFLNIGDLPPPPLNEFNFKISGNILLGRLKDGDDDDDDGSQALPIFRVLSAEKPRVEFIVTSEMQQGIEIIQPNEKRGHRPNMVNGLRTPQAPGRRKFLKKKTTVHADDGVRVILSSAVPSSPTESPLSRFTATPRTPIRGSPLRSPRTPRGAAVISSPGTGASYAISWVHATVKLLPSSKQHSHAIQFTVPAVAATDGVLSFGVSLPSFLAGDAETAIDIVSATAGEVHLPVEVFPRAALEDDEKRESEKYERIMRPVDYTTASGQFSREELSGQALRDIDTWIRISLPDDRGSGKLDVRYLVARDPKLRNQKSSLTEQLTILLPSFHVGVGTYTVDIHTPQGYKKPLLLSNFHQQEDGQLSHYRLPGYFNPQLRAQIESQGGTVSNLPMRSIKATGWLLGRMMDAIPALASLIMLWIMITIREDVRDLRFLSNLPLASNWASQVRNPPENFGGNAQTTTATFPYTVDTATATPYNNQPTGSGAELDITKQMYSLMPLPLALIPRLDWARLADALLMSVEKLMGFFHAVLHFPAPP